MIKRITALALVVLLPVLLGAAKCEEGDTHPSAPRVPQVPRTPAAPATGRAPVPDPHAGDPQPSGRKERVITINIRVGSKEQLPATVYISTLGAAVEPPSITEPIADTHRATFTLVFDANTHGVLSITAAVITAKDGSGTWCSIEAGTYGNDPPRFAAGRRTVTCHLVIRR
jgi:hypothetical protein